MGYKKKMAPKNVNFKYNTMQMPMDECFDNEECPSDPDLLLIRDAAADERAAIAFYLRAGHETCLADLFLRIAADEMYHFAELMEMAAALDPVQAEVFDEVGLDFMAMPRGPKKPAKWHPPVEDTPESEDTSEECMETTLITPPDPNDFATIDTLTHAIIDELQAINKYQRYMEQACHPEVKAMFCHIMNEEKIHVALFMRALFCLTHEPLPHEHD